MYEVIEQAHIGEMHAWDAFCLPRMSSTLSSPRPGQRSNKHCQYSGWTQPGVSKNILAQFGEKSTS